MLSSKNTIPKSNQYHFLKFYSNHLVIWRYFDIGLGKRWNYTEVKFDLAIQIVLPFSATSKHNHINSKSKRPSLDRSINTLKFCPETGCSKTFVDYPSLEEHLL